MSTINLFVELKAWAFQQFNIRNQRNKRVKKNKHAINVYLFLPFGTACDNFTLETSLSIGFPQKKWKRARLG